MGGRGWRPGSSERSDFRSDARPGGRDDSRKPSGRSYSRNEGSRSSGKSFPRSDSRSGKGPRGGSYDRPASKRWDSRESDRPAKKESVFRPDYSASDNPEKRKKKAIIKTPARLPSGRRITKHKHDRKVVLPDRPDPDLAIDELEIEGVQGKPSQGSLEAGQSIFREPVRINRYLARAGYGSRRQVEDYVTSGRVKLNGKVVEALDTKVGPGDLVTLDGKRVRFTEGHIYQAFNKPMGYTVSAKSFPGSPSIYEILPESLHGLKYAGRLDKESRGLVVLSNDGEFLNQVMHPARRVTKRYIVTLDELPEAEELTRSFYKGVVDDGELLRAVRVGILDRADRTVEVILSEGRKRQIRRMFQALDVKVLDLYRVSVGFLSLENHPVKEGETFSFEPEELFGMKKSDPVLGDFNPWKEG